jgi:hypothetical protein
MRRPRSLPCSITLALVAACGGDLGPAPADPSDGSRLAAQFEDLAGQLGDSGTSATASALRHAAQIVRLVGHATPVTVTVDGVAHDWLAVAEQLDYPLLTCTWAAPGGPGEGDGSPPPGGGSVPPDSGSGGGGAGGGVLPPDSAGGTGGGPGQPECTETGTNSLRSIIAWEPEHMSQVVRMTAEPGRSEVKPGVPDVMAGLPTPAAPAASGDTAVTGGGTYGFMGEYFKDNGGIFWTVEGTQTNSREAGSGACTESHTTFDWATFDCVTAQLGFAVDMRVEGGRYEPLTGRPGPDGAEGSPDLESHEISLPAATVDAAVLKVVSWTAPTPEPGPPPEPEPGPDPVPPVDSTTGGALPR